MEIRRLSGEDAEMYRALRLRGLEESPTAFGSSYAEEVDRPLAIVKRRLADENNHVFGAFTGDGQLAGMVTLRREPYVKMAHKGHIIAMYVAPDERRQGAGRALMETAIARAVALGLRQLNLTVTSSNGAAVALYEACGFERYGLERDAIRIGDTFYDDAYMMLRLAGNE